MPDAEAILKKARESLEDSLRLHRLYKGKIQIVPKCPIRSLQDFAIWYTPGVAAPCQASAAHPDLRITRPPAATVFAHSRVFHADARGN